MLSRSAASRRPRRTLLAVAGAGTLLVPAALAGRPGTQWAALAAGVVLLVWHVLVARAGGTRGRGVAGLAAEAFGPRAEVAVHVLYFAGIACGQAAVAGAAGEFAADGRAATVVSAAVLLVAGGCAHAGLLPGPGGRATRLAAVLLLTAAWWLLPGLLRLDGRLPDGGAWGPAAVLVVLFAWVGAEGDVPALPRLRPRAVARLLYGPAVCAASLALVLAAPQPGPDSVRAARVAGAAAAVVLTAYCATNLASCGARWSRLWLRSAPLDATVPAGTPAKAPAAASPVTRRGIWAAVAVAAAVLALARAVHLPAAVLLLGPGTATACVLVLPAAAALRLHRATPVPEASLPGAVAPSSDMFEP
ncbi:hypothetical protein [Streptomyces montanisoli]|uniref:hypothetical protein n=1 Tax=Streptomyces montanisoli TaxID=2798581 RepID=UPI001FD7F0DA|nr:hypothetical protein [Streptomyces montanisoli]